VEFAGELVNCWGSNIVSHCCEKLVTEAGDSMGTQKKGNIPDWKPYQRTGEYTAD
jgi:hypothetical protein